MSQPGGCLLCSAVPALTLSKCMKTSARLQRPHTVLGAVHKAKGRPRVQANRQNTAGEREVQGQLCLRCPVPTDKSPGVGRRHIHLQTQDLGAVVVWFTLTSLRSHSGVQQIREHQDSFLILFTKLQWCELDRFTLARQRWGVALQHLTAQLHVHGHHKGPRRTLCPVPIS